MDHSQKVRDAVARLGASIDVKTSLTSRYAATSVPLNINGANDWTTLEWETYFCGNMSAVTVSDLSVYVANTRPREMPECFFNLSSNLVSLSTQGLTIRGVNATFGPLERIAFAAPNLLELDLSSSPLVDQDGHAYLVDWSTVFSSASSLQKLRIFGCSLYGTLPNQLPVDLTSFDVNGNNLNLRIPSTIFSATNFTTDFYFDIAGNRISDEIPSDLFASIPLHSLVRFHLDLSSNLLSGSIPAQLFNGTFTAVREVNINFQGNSDLHGELGPLFEQSNFRSGTLEKLHLYASYCGFSGPFPAAWFDSLNFTSMRDVIIELHRNRLTGSIPTDIWTRAVRFGRDIEPVFTSCVRPYDLCSIRLDFSNNQLSSIIPIGLTRFTPASPTPAFNDFTVNLSGNNLTGSIPAELFINFNWTAASSFSLDLKSNLLSGNLPTTLVNHNFLSNLGQLMLDLRHNPTLAGTIPSTFLQSINPRGTIPTASTMGSSTISLYFSGTKLTGPLEIPDLSDVLHYRPTYLDIESALTNFQSLIVNTSTVRALRLLDLTQNLNLIGTIPNQLFTNSSSLRTLKASGTQLSGVINDLGANVPSFVALDLSGTSIDFCSGNRTLWAPDGLLFCDLSYTSAYMCGVTYPSTCSLATNPETPPTSQCSSNTKPGPEFECLNGIWTATKTINSTTLTIPSGATQIVIQNLTSASIIFQGTGSTLVVNGCASNLTYITIDLTQQDLRKIGSKLNQTLLLSNGNCTNLNAVKVTGRVIESGCRKVKVSRMVADRTLTALFTVDKSGCNRWWIILVSVICVLIIIGVAVGAIIIWYMTNKKLGSSVAKPSVNR